MPKSKRERGETRYKKRRNTEQNMARKRKTKHGKTGDRRKKLYIKKKAVENAKKRHSCLASRKEEQGEEENRTE